jgi:HD-GYP domain-containing protein (c-di-GMP phosphodiesterase class II)
MVIHYPAYGSRGELLLAGGTALDDRAIRMLRERAVLAVYVDPEDGYGDATAEIVAERVRATIALGLCQVYDVEIGDFAQAAQTARALQEEVERVIASALSDPPTLGCLGTLNQFDPYQFVHALDSTVIAVMLGRQLRLPFEQLVRVASGCLLHDYGMIAIDSAIWNKPSILTADERSTLNQHTRLGFALLQQNRPDRVAENTMALQHHERQDRSGYPNRLAGGNVAPRGPSTVGQPGRILPDAEIIAVADVYDALISDRPWREALLPDVVVRTMRQAAGDHLNQELVREILTLVTPYPLGATVIVANGPYRYFRGIVARVHRDAFNQPAIRLLQDTRMEPIEPIDLDLRNTRTVIACIPAPGHHPVVELTPEAIGALRMAGQASGR